jgi:hypothetical protein
MARREINLRWAALCGSCGTALSPRTRAVWDDDTKSATCLPCDALQTAPPEVAPATMNESEPQLRAGTAGGSARREYQRRHDARDKRVSKKFGFFAPVVRVIAPDPQSTTAWSKGAVGEEKLGASLSRRLGDKAVLLADCSVPRSRKNIDFIVIAKSGVWVIDAKRYAGAVQVRDMGGWRSVDRRLFVAGRDRTSHVDGLAWQVDVVRTALGNEEVPITSAFCMVDAEFGFFAKPVQLRGVWVTWGKKLAEMIISSAACVEDAGVREAAARLTQELPPRI